MRKLVTALAIGVLIISQQASAQDKISVTSVSAKEPVKKMALIAGVLKDARTKSPLIEGVITLSSTAFEGRKIALTDSSGTYMVKDLPAGVYTVTFEMEGFRTFTQENIVLKEGMSLGVSFEMVKDRVKSQEKAVVKTED
ncbi:MAG: TonB-dependent receptor [Segetibacter sp.]|jgi:hypothetical protein|nr:TonB-dependent receptor [Segetibacter sp.]